jgi:hypothetical protein
MDGAAGGDLGSALARLFEANVNPSDRIVTRSLLALLLLLLLIEVGFIHRCCDAPFGWHLCTTSTYPSP